jgi:hypothetical protein
VLNNASAQGKGIGHKEKNLAKIEQNQQILKDCF